MSLTRLLSVVCACLLLTGCEGTATIEDARAAAAEAQAAVEQMITSQQQGNAQAAMDAAKQAEYALAAARDRFLSARADQSNDVDLLVEFADVCARLGDTDLAGEAFLRAAELRQEDATLWYRAGRNFVDAGGRYLARAVEPLDRAEQVLQSQPGAVSMADIEAARGDVSWNGAAYEIANSRYAAALLADPASSRALMGTSMVAIAIGAPLRAEAALTDLQANGGQVDPKFVETRLREAYLVYREKRPAIPDDPAAYRALAGIAIRVGFLDDARAAAEHALKLNPDDVFALNMAGSLAHRAGDFERARQAFTHSLELQPDQPRTREALAALPTPGVGQGPLR